MKGRRQYFDFRDRIEQAVKAFSPNRSQTLSQYATDLADQTHRALVEACASEDIRFDNASELGAPFAWVFISGYFKQVASSVIIEFFRENRQFAKPKVSPDELIVGMPRRHGSHKIDAYLYQNHPPFCNDRYLRPLEVPLPHFSEAMKGAVLRSRQYIEICSSSEARELDDFCKTIGGDIHMVSITRKDGFSWVPGFKPKGIE